MRIESRKQDGHVKGLGVNGKIQKTKEEKRNEKRKKHFNQATMHDPSLTRWWFFI